MTPYLKWWGYKDGEGRLHVRSAVNGVEPVMIDSIRYGPWEAASKQEALLYLKRDIVLHKFGVPERKNR